MNITGAWKKSVIVAPDSLQKKKNENISIFLLELFENTRNFHRVPNNGRTKKWNQNTRAYQAECTCARVWVYTWMYGWRQWAF